MPIEPFFLLVIDDDQKTFNVIGPLTDDRSWLDSLLERKQAGRNVRMCHAPATTSLAAVASGYTAQTKYRFTQEPCRMTAYLARYLFPFMALLLVACHSAADRKRTERLDDAITAMRKLSSAVEVGVNYEQYSTLVIEAKAKVDLAKDVFPGDIGRQLDTTLENYADARKAWGEKFRNWAILDVEDSVGKAILEKYSLPIEERTWITDKGRRDSAMGIQFDDALHEIWRIGQQNLDKLIAASKPK